MSGKTIYQHITIDDHDVAYIADTTMKVVELVQAHLGHGYSPAELHFQFPHLTMGQIHAALAYYWDNKVELDADIARRHPYVQDLRQSAPASPFAQRMRQQGYLP